MIGRINYDLFPLAYYSEETVVRTPEELQAAGHVRLLTIVLPMVMPILPRDCVVVKARLPVYPEDGQKLLPKLMLASESFSPVAKGDMVPEYSIDTDLRPGGGHWVRREEDALHDAAHQKIVENLKRDASLRDTPVRIAIKCKGSFYGTEVTDVASGRPLEVMSAQINIGPNGVTAKLQVPVESVEYEGVALRSLPVGTSVKAMIPYDSADVSYFSPVTIKDAMRGIAEPFRAKSPDDVEGHYPDATELIEMTRGRLGSESPDAGNYAAAVIASPDKPPCPPCPNCCYGITGALLPCEEHR